MNDVYRVAAGGGTPLPVAGDRYSAEFWSSASPDGRTLAITARSRASVDWWRNGSSHIDQSEIWLVGNVEPGASGAPRYSPITGKGAKSEWPMWSRRRCYPLFRQRSRRSAESLDPACQRRRRASSHEFHERARALAGDLTRRRSDHVRARLRNLGIRSRQQLGEGNSDQSARGARREWDRAPHSYERDSRACPRSRRKESRVRGARRDLRRIGKGRRRCNTRDDDSVSRWSSAMGTGQPTHRIRQRQKRRFESLSL